MDGPAGSPRSMSRSVLHTDGTVKSASHPRSRTDSAPRLSSVAGGGGVASATDARLLRLGGGIAARGDATDAPRIVASVSLGEN
eukprot:28401-Pelagococcus_subviridis.AAC.4